MPSDSDHNHHQNLDSANQNPQNEENQNHNPQNEENQNETTQNPQNDSPHTVLIGDDSRSDDGTSPADYSFFDRLLDTALGRNPDTPSSADASAEAPSPSATNNQDNPNGSATASTTTNDGAGAIIITVNYMFMDGSDNGGPGRSGSLVVTLPNNAANREPNTIHLFISLATGMAYSALVSNAHKNKGISLKKFQSFPVKPLEDVAEPSCSICFEQYDEPPKLECYDHECVTKKRKTGEREHTPSATAENDREEERRTLENCLIDWKHVPVQLPCGHIFGQACLAHWLKDNLSCPLCRVSLADEEDGPANNDENSTRFPPVSYFRFGNFDADNNDTENNNTDSNNDNNNNTTTIGENLTSESAAPPYERINNEIPAPFDGSRPSPTSRASHASNISQPSHDSHDQASSRSSSRSRRLLGLLHRATSVIFNPHHHRRSPPPPPFDAQPRDTSTRSRNTSVSPMINQILGLFGRSRRNRERDHNGSSSLFASGVSSRRTANGVETVTNERHDDQWPHSTSGDRDAPSSDRRSGEEHGDSSNV